MTCSHNDELCAAHLGLAGASVGLPVATAAAPSLLAGCWPQRLVCKSSRRPSQVLDPNPVSCSQAEQTPDAVRDKVTAAKLKCAGALAALDAKKYKAAAKKFSEARAPRAAPRNALRVCSAGLPSRPDARQWGCGACRLPGEAARPLCSKCRAIAHIGLSFLKLGHPRLRTHACSGLPALLHVWSALHSPRSSPSAASVCVGLLRHCRPLH